MDTTAIAPPAAAWDLLADLATCGQDGIALADTQALTSAIAERVRAHLPCPWGLILLRSAGDAAIADWNLDEAQQRALLNRNGHPLPPHTAEIRLEHEHTPVGVVLLGAGPDLEPLFVAPFRAALRRQIELLVALQRREAERRSNQPDAAALIDLDIVGQLDLHQALRSLLERAVKLGGAQAALLAMPTDGDEFEIMLTHGLSRDYSGVHLAAGEGLVGQVALTNAMHVVEDYQAYQHRSNHFQDEHWRSLVGVPLIVQDELIGVLSLARGQEQPPLQERDRQILAAFARSAALVLRNAQLFAQQQQRARELYVLYENGQVISSQSNVESMLARVAENITLAMGAERCLLHLVDPSDPTMLYEAASYSIDESDTASDQRYAAATYKLVEGVLKTGDPVVLGGVRGAAANALPGMDGHTSGLLLPLKVRETSIGLLAVGYTDRERRFSRAELSLARTLADQVATAVMNLRLYEAEQRRRSELESLQSISQRLEADQDLHETLTAILEGVSALVPFAAAQICLYEPDDQVLRAVLAHNITPSPAGYRLSEGFSGWLARYRKPLRLASFQRPPVRPTTTRLTSGEHARSYLGLPLLMGEQLVGTLELFGSRHNAFTEVNERMLVIVAGQAARAIASARRYEQTDEHLRSRLQQLMALQRISRQLTATLSLDLILTFALEEALRATPATQGYIALRAGNEDGLKVTDAETAELLGYIALAEGGAEDPFRVLGAAGYDYADANAIVGELLRDSATVAGDAIRSGEPCHGDELAEDDRLNGIGPAVAAALAMPIFYEAHLVGVVNLHSQHPRAFDHDTTEFVRALTDQIALAIGNAQRYDEQQRQRTLLQQRASMLNEVLKIGQVLRADRSIEEVLEQIAFSIVDTAGFRRAVFNTVDPDDPEVIRVSTGAGLALADLERLRGAVWPEGLAQRLLDKRFRIGRCFFLTQDAMREVSTGLDLEGISATSIVGGNDPGEWQTGDELFVPLYSTGARLLGMLSVDDPYNRLRPTRRSVEMLEVFADQAAIAIENAGLLREARAQAEQMRALYQVGAATVSTLDLDDLIERVFNEIVAYMGLPSFFFVSSYDHQHRSMRFELFKRGRETLVSHHKLVEPKAGLSGAVIDSGEILHIRDYPAEQQQLPAQAVVIAPDIRSWVGIPLRSQNQVIGVLSVQNVEAYAFSERHIQFLSTLANQLAVALENTQLFTERERRIAELDVINTIGRITSATLDLRIMLNQIYDCLASFLTMDAFYVFVGADSADDTSLCFEVDQGARAVEELERGPLPGSLTERIFATRQPLLFHDIARELEESEVTPVMFGATERTSRSWVGVPLLRGEGDVIGALSVQSYTPDLYGEREVAFLTTLASQVALGVQNARLFNQAQEQVEHLSLLNRVSAVAATTLNISEIYQAAADAMARVTSADQARVVLYDRSNDVVRIAAEFVPSGMADQIVIPVKDNPSIEWLDRHRRPLISMDAQNDKLFARSRELFRSLDIRSVALIPLLVGDHVAGAIGLDAHGAARRFSEQEIELCQTIANQASMAIEKARLFSETQRSAEALGDKVGELSTLLEAARVLSSSLKPREVLDTLMEVVGRHLNVTTVGLWTIGADNTMKPAALLGVLQDVADTMLVPVGQGLTGRVAAEGRALIVADVEAEGSSLYQDFNRKNKLTSFMGVPVVYREKTIGVLSVMTVRRRVFSADEVTLLAGMADQAAIALENARLFEERERRIAELTTFNRISQDLNATLDVDELLAALHGGIGEVLDISESFVALYDPATQRLTFPVFWEGGRLSRTDLVLDVGQRPSLSGRVVTERKPVLLRSRQEIESQVVALHTSNRPIESWLSVPIMQGDEVFGIINVQSYEPNAYDEDDQRFLITVAGQAATAIARAQLFSERERRLREVSVLKDIGNTVTSTLNLQDVLERLRAELGRVIDVTTSFIGLYDAEQNTLAYPIAYDNGAPVQLPPVRLEASGINNWVISNQQPLRINTDAEAEPYRAGAARERVGPDGQNEESYLVVPIISGEDVLGVINVQSYRQYAFDQDDLRFVATVANQAAIAINNARLFQERGRRIEELATFNDIGQQFSAVSRLDDLLTLIYRQTSRLLDTTNFYIALYDEQSGLVSFPLFYDRGERVAASPLSAKDSLTHFVIQTREPFLLQGIDQHDQLDARQVRPVGPRSRSWLGVPMIANDHVIGVIAIQDYERENAYSQDDVRLLSTLASWGAVALANARLFSETQKSFQELGELYDISVELAGTLDATAVQRTVVENALELLKAPLGAMLLFDDKLQVAQEFVFDVNGGPAHPSFGNGTAELIPTLLDRDRPVALRDIAATQPTLAGDLAVHALLGAVIGGREQPLGVIWLGDRQPRDWQEREISLLSILATLASQALKSARLFQSEMARRRAADTLREVAQKLTSLLEPDEIMSLILDQLARVVRYDTASLMLRDGERVRVVKTRGFPKAVRATVERLSFDLSTDENLARIVETRQPLVLADAQLSPDFVQVKGTEHIRGWIGAPLLLDDEVIGLLTVDSRQVGAYNEEDGQLAFALTSQAAQALRNARLFDEVRRFNAELEQRVEERTAALAELNAQLADEKERLQAVHAITTELTASLDLDETLMKTLRLAARNLGVKRGSIMLWEEQSRMLVCRAVLGNDGEVLATRTPISFVTGTGLAGWVKEHQQPLCIGDVRKDRRWLHEEGRADEVRSVVAVPLMTQEIGTLGVLMLTSPQVNYFSKAQEQLLLTIANEVAIVIHNAELYSLINDMASRVSNMYEQQREETSKNLAILQSLGEGVLVLDETQTVILFNPAAEQMLDIPEAQLLGQQLADLSSYGDTTAAQARSKEIYEAFQAGLSALADQNKNYNRRLEISAPAQSIELNFTPVIGPNGTIYGSVVVLRDVTREIEADRAKRDFISSVSHELRTPLTSIKGYVDLLLLGAAGPVSEGQLSFLSVVKNNANRLMDLINDILEIGRIDANKIQLNFEPVDVAAVLQDVLQTLRAEIDRKSIVVDLDLQADLPKIAADARRLTQVVLNLVSNAVKYTYAKGHVELRAFLNPAGMLEIDVQDNGVGISPEQQQYLFRRFYRADNPLRDEAGGTGLGLAIAKSFVELHGGEMWVQSEIGQGSTFSFIVPVTQPERPPTDEDV